MSKNANWNRPLVLAIVLTVIGAGAIWLEYSYRPKKESAEEEAKKLFPLKGTQVAQIRISDGARSYVFRCLDMETKLCQPGDNSKWELVEPSRMRADDANVNSLVSSLNNLSSTESIDLKEDPADKRARLLKEYGLGAETRASTKKAEVKTGSGDTITVWMGDLHPIGDSYFAISAKQEDQVELVPTPFKETFDHDLAYWRDKKIVTLSPDQVRAFELSGSKGAVTASRGPDGDWRIQSGKTDFQGDIESVDNLISSAVYTGAKRFVSESKTDARAKLALAGARAALTLKFTAGDSSEPLALPSPGASPPAARAAPVVLSFYEKKSGATKTLYATASNLDPLYEIDANMLGRLDKSAKDLRLAKLITSMDRFTTKRLVFKGGTLGDQPLVIAQDDGGKWRVEGSEGEAASDKIQRVIDRIAGNRIRDFVARKNQAPGQERGIQVSLSDAKGADKRKIVFWKTANALYARDLLAPAEAESLLVDPAIWDALPTGPDFFKPSPKPSGVPAAPAPGGDEAHLSGDGHEGHSH